MYPAWRWASWLKSHARCLTVVARTVSTPFWTSGLAEVELAGLRAAQERLPFTGREDQYGP
jgi:hypothetical protein